MLQVNLTMILVTLLVVSIVLIRMQRKRLIVPLSVNYHFTRLCNYSCGFCFHTSKTSHVASLDEAKHALQKLSLAGMKKLNFAGGEPMLNSEFVGLLAQFAKQELGLESVSIVTNGSIMPYSFLKKYAEFIDIIAVSCDSFDEKVNKQIGRGEKGTHVSKMYQIKNWCHEFGIKFKLNTVVNAYNYKEDMIEQVKALAPFRWKCFQVLVLDSENTGKDALRNADEFVVSNEQFDSFIKRHESLACIVPESNSAMRNSYLILDEYLRFLNCKEGKNPSNSLLVSSVQDALLQSGWDTKEFEKRGGLYDWSKKTNYSKEGCTNVSDKNLTW